MQEVNTKLQDNKNTTILSQNIHTDLDNHISNLNNNVLVLGWAGTGKTVSVVKPNLAQMNTNYIVTDMHNELYDCAADFLKNDGYQVQVVDFWNATGAHYNPFYYLNTASLESINNNIKEVVSLIIETTAPEGESMSSDPFYLEMEKMILRTLMLHTYLQHSNNASFMHMFATLQQFSKAENIYEAYRVLLDEIEAKYPGTQLVTNAYKFVTVNPETEESNWPKPVKMLKGVFISLAARLVPFQHYYVNKNETKKTVDELNLEQFVSEKRALFVNVSMCNKMMLPLVTLLMYQASCMLIQEDTKLKQKGMKSKYITRFIMDEFAYLAPIPDFDTVLATTSKYNIAYIVLLHDLMELKHLYKDRFETIVAGFDTIIHCGRIGLQDAIYLIERFGNEIIIPEPKRKMTLRLKIHMWLKKHMIGAENMQYVHAYSPDELSRSINMKNCIIYKRGEKPVLDEKYWPDKK